MYYAALRCRFNTDNVTQLMEKQLGFLGMQYIEGETATVDRRMNQ